VLILAAQYQWSAKTLTGKGFQRLKKFLKQLMTEILNKRIDENGSLAC
jgi:hypothetical protein